MREFLLHAEATLPRERLDAAIARFAGRGDHGFDRARPAFGVVASRWYDAGQLHALLDALVESLEPAARERLIQGGARAVMDATLRGIYKLLFDWMATPDRYARFAPKLWASYYDGGTFLVEPLDPHAARCTICGWHSHHPVICELNRAAAAAIYEAMGCRGVTVERQRCLGDGDACDEFITRWQPRGPG